MHVEIDYMNWRGERKLRRIEPLNGGLVRQPMDAEYHPGQWTLRAYDLDRIAQGAPRVFALRNFALAGIHAWREIEDMPIPLTESQLALAVDLFGEENTRELVEFETELKAPGPHE